MFEALLVFIGGGIGALTRFWLTGVIHRMTAISLPIGTLVVNTVGCFFIGFLMAGFEQRFLVPPSLRLFLTIGLLGGFTTFSTFSYETIALLRDGEVLFATGNILLSLFLCLFATAIGTLTGKLL